MKRCPKCNLFTCKPVDKHHRQYFCKNCGYFPSYPIKDKLGREIDRIPFIPKNNKEEVIK